MVQLFHLHCLAGTEGHLHHYRQQAHDYNKAENQRKGENEGGYRVLYCVDNCVRQFRPVHIFHQNRLFLFNLQKSKPAQPNTNLDQT